MDGTWIYHFNLEPKMTLMQWKTPSPPSPKKSKVTLSGGNVMLPCFVDYEGVRLTTWQIYKPLEFGDKIRSESVRKWRGKLNRGILAHAHRARSVQTTEKCDFEILPHPAYSPDLTPSDFFYFLI